MFQDVDETLRAVLMGDVPIKRNEIDIAFDRPTREWSGRLTRPTLNAFLYDIREREDMRDDVPFVTRDANGQAVRQRPPRRIDLSYLLTAWTTEPDDEHRILGRVLASMYRMDTLRDDQLQGDLKQASYPVLTRVARPDQILKPHDLWGSLDNELHTPLVWVWTVPLDVFRTSTGPLVRTTELRIGPIGGPVDVTLVEVGGLVHKAGDPLNGLAGVRLKVIGTRYETETDEDGKFRFINMPTGEYRWRVEPPGGKAREHKIVVPSGDYDIEV